MTKKEPMYSASQLRAALGEEKYRQVAHSLNLAQLMPHEPTALQVDEVKAILSGARANRSTNFHANLGSVSREFFMTHEHERLELLAWLGKRQAERLNAGLQKVNGLQPLQPGVSNGRR